MKKKKKSRAASLLTLNLAAPMSLTERRANARANGEAAVDGDACGRR